MNAAAFPDAVEARAPTPQLVFRGVDATAAATLEHLQGSEPLGAGRVCVATFAALADRLGPKWPLRRDVVHEHAERTLHRWIGEAGVCQRISETEFVVVQPNVDRLTGQALCVNAMRETLAHFLGEARHCDIVVHEVASIGPDGVFGERVNALNAPSAAGPHELATFEEAAPALVSPDRWSPFATAEGHRVRVSCALEPVFQLKISERIGYRLSRRVLHMPNDAPLTEAERRALSAGDTERVDFATMARGLGRLRTTGAKEPTLILPVTYTTLASQRARQTLIGFLKEAQSTVRHGLICEVCDIEGVPPGALLRAISLVKPYCLFVAGHLAEAPQRPLGELREGGLQSLSIDYRGPAAGEADFIGWTHTLLRMTRPATKAVIVYKLVSPRHAAIAGMLGVTHGSLRPSQAGAEAHAGAEAEAIGAG